MTSDDNSQTLILETLSTLQQLFKKTIQEYNKISSQLVHSSDNVVIYKIWHDYLGHVKSFLHSSVPTDYNVLKEHLHLCKIHKNLLTNQKSALMHKLSIDPHMPGDIEMLKNKHIDLLKELHDRQIEVERRIEMWEKHRNKQINILDQIDDIEREKSLLQLKQIYLKSVPKTKQQIAEILERVTNVEGAVASVKKNQPNLLNFIDEITSNSIRMEYATTSQRLSNIRAGLETWDGYLNRIQELQNNYETNIKTVQSNFQQHMQFLENIRNDMAKNHHNSNQHLMALREKQNLLSKSKADLELLDNFKEELKQYVSVYDTKMIRQTIWILWQQFTDLNHEYSLLINQIEERHCLQTEFIIRYDNLMLWLNETESRLIDSPLAHSNVMEDESHNKHYANNLLEEFALKEYDRKWIVSVGNELLHYYSTEANYDSPEKIEIECKIANLNTKWNNIKLMHDNKSRKINEIKTTYFNLEARIAEIRAWLFETEKELLKPFVFENADQKSFDKLLDDQEKLQRSAENKSSNIAEILNLSEMMLTDLRSFEMDFNIKNLDLAINNIDYRWKKLCETLVQRKRSLLSIWSSLEELTKITNANKDWITDCDNLCNSYEFTKDKLNREQCKKDIDLLNEQLHKISTNQSVFQILEKQYNTLMTSNLDIESLKRVTSDSRKILIIWKQITIKITTIRTMLEKYLNDYNQFETLHENIVLNLTQIDVEVTNIKHLKLYENEDEESMRVHKVLSDLNVTKKLIESAEGLKALLLQSSDEEESMKIQAMSDEYMKLYDSIRINFEEIAAKYPGMRLSMPVEEKSVAVQVNTLQAQSSVSPKDAYLYEIRAAIEEFRTNIEIFEQNVRSVDNLETGLLPKGTTSKTNKSIAACESSLELIRYLNALLIKEYKCTDTEAFTDEITSLHIRFQLVLEMWNSKKALATQTFADHDESDWHSCPFCSQRNWQQIDNDLWRLEQWLHLAETQRKTQTTPPSNIEELEDVIQDHREFLLNLDSHKSIISSLNTVGEHLALHTTDTEKARQLRKRLQDDNVRWENICKHAANWQTLLQQSLISNKEFHKMINEFSVWLEDTEQKIKNFEPVDLASEKSIMESKFIRFKELRNEIERCEPRVISLQENAAQLLKSSKTNQEISHDTYMK